MNRREAGSQPSRTRTDDYDIPVRKVVEIQTCFQGFDVEVCHD